MTKSTASRNQQPEVQVNLFPYQREAVTDESRFCLYVWARQLGKDFSISLKHVRRRLRIGGLTVCIAAGQRQTLETIEKVKLHSQAMQAKFDYREIEFPGMDFYATQVVWKHNGARFLAMPANPDTVRGFTGDAWLNEVAFMKHAQEMRKAAFAIASRGFHVDISSTPNGQAGVFWDVCKACGVSPLGAMEKTHWIAGPWSVHWCDVHTAIAQGYPMDFKAMREAINDEDTVLQEYELHFLADAENFIPMELVIACESEDATLEMPAGFIAQGPLYLGVDVGRRKDRTVLWLKEKVGDVLWTRAVTVLERTPFRAQFSIIDALMPMITRACVDETGIGMQLAEDLKAKWGAKVEPVTFNLENKEKMAVAQKANFEERRERIPAAAFIRRSISAVKRFTSTTGHFRFDADRTDQGHADEFWAGSLAAAAAQGPALSVELQSAGMRTAASSMNGYSQPERSAFSQASGF